MKHRSFVEPVVVHPSTHDRVYLVRGDDELDVPFERGSVRVGEGVYVHPTKAAFGMKAIVGGVYTVDRIEPWS